MLLNNRYHRRQAGGKSSQGRLPGGARPELSLKEGQDSGRQYERRQHREEKGATGTDAGRPARWDWPSLEGQGFVLGPRGTHIHILMFRH